MTYSPGYPDQIRAMIQTFKLTIEYDGTTFFGWQRQADKPSIQGELEQVLSRILNQPICLAGSGRTDAGVHALGQVASFSADTAMHPRVLQKEQPDEASHCADRMHPGSP